MPANAALIKFDASLHPSPITTADDLAAAFLAAYGRSTRLAYRRDLNCWGCWLRNIGVDVLAAHRAHVDVWIREQENDGAAPATISRRLSTISGYYNYAQDENLIARNPVARLRRPKMSDESPRFGLDRNETAAFLAAAEQSDVRAYALSCLLALNGLRISETLALDVADLGSERGHRTIRLHRKGGKVMLAPLAPRTADALATYLAGREAGPLFVTRTGGRLDRQSAWKLVRLAQSASINKPISPHSLRHGFVTVALDAGVPLHRVQDAAGHASPATTQRYNRARFALDGHATYAVAAAVA